MRSDRHKVQSEAVRSMMESHREEEELEQQKEQYRRITERDHKQR